MRNANIFELSQFPRNVTRSLTALDASDNNLTSLAGLENYRNLESLDVSENPLRANAERGLTGALPRVRFVGFRGAPVHGLLLAEKLAADALTTSRDSKSYQSSNLSSYSGQNSGWGRTGQPAADSFDFGALRLAVDAECFPSDGRVVFGLRCESARGPLYEVLEVVAYAVSLDYINLLKRVAIFPHGAQNRSQNVSDAEFCVQGPGARGAAQYVVVCACFREVLRICVFDVFAGGVQTKFARAAADVQARLDALFPGVAREELVGAVKGAQNAKFAKIFGDCAKSAYAQHFDTRLRFGPAREGQWLQILPGDKLDSATWFQTVLTFGQLAAGVQRHLLEQYSLSANFGDAAELAFGAFPTADVFGGQLHLRLGIGQFCERSSWNSSSFPKSGWATFSTPVDELAQFTGKAQAFCREPSKIVFVRATRGRVSTFLASTPVEFSPHSSFTGVVRFRLLGSLLVCVHYSESPEPGVVYRFARDGEVLQESESPFLDVFGLPDGPGGEYEVSALSGTF